VTRAVVLDASAALRLVVGGGPVPSGVSEAVQGARTGSVLLMVPPLFYSEVTHALLRYQRSGRLTADEIDEVCAVIDGLPLQAADPPGSVGAIARVARDRGLSGYDATYVLLAEELGGALLTADERLARALQA